MKKNDPWSVSDSKMWEKMIKKQEFSSETLTIKEKGNDYSLTIQHDQSGSSYGIDIPEDVYNQLGDHFHKSYSNLKNELRRLKKIMQETPF